MTFRASALDVRVLRIRGLPWQSFARGIQSSGYQACEDSIARYAADCFNLGRSRARRGSTGKDSAWRRRRVLPAQSRRRRGGP
jgi:hypothetical protein